VPGSVEVVVPFRGGCPHREAAWRWCRPRYPWPVTEAIGGDPWVKATVVMPAIAASSAEIIVVADADVWCDGLEAGVRAVRGGALWAVPHSEVVRLTEEGSRAFMAGEPWQQLPMVERPRWGFQGGGYVIARRDTLLEIPLDPRFVGWGQEDHSWGIALYALLCPSWRGSEPLIHLWHPSAPRLNRKRGSNESWALYRRYCEARRSLDEMRSLVKEARDALQADQPALHPDPTLGR
jgi:hypothetical protein